MRKSSSILSTVAVYSHEMACCGRSSELRRADDESRKEKAREAKASLSVITSFFPFFLAALKKIEAAE